MKKLSTLFVLLFPLALFAQNVDSVKYKRQWFYVYPYDHIKENNWHTSVESEDIFVPIASLPDGNYIQFYHKKSIREHYRSKRQLKKLKREKPVIHALFTIKNGKIHGTALFFSEDGKLNCKGAYAENLKTGRWYYGKKMNFYYTFSQGMLDGECYSEISSLAWRKSEPYTYYHYNYYENGTFKNGFVRYADKNGTTYRDETTEIRNHDSTYAYSVTKTFRNDTLFMERHFISYVLGHDTSWTYFPNGKIMSRFIVHSRMYEDRELRSRFDSWVNHYPYLAGEDFTLNFVYSLDKHRRIPFNIADELKKRKQTDYYLNGTCEHYFENGNLQLRIINDNNGTQIDTLYYQNGKPRYFLKKQNGGLLFEYYDTTGFKTHESSYKPEINPLPAISVSDPKQNTIVYNGYSLYQVNTHQDRYEYSAQLPELNDLINADSTFYFFISTIGNTELFALSYNPKDQTRTELLIKNPGNKNYYSRELVHRFDSCFTSSHSTLTVKIGDQFKVVTDFKINTDFKVEKLAGIKNWYELEQKQNIKPFCLNLSRRSDFSTEHLYASIKMIVDSVETNYYYQNEPLDGALEVHYHSNQNKVKKSPDQCVVHLTGSYYTYHATNITNQIYSRENQLVNHKLLTSDLFPDADFYFSNYSLPYQWRADNLIDLNPNYRKKRKYRKNQVETVYAILQDGKLHGNFEISYRDSRKTIERYYENGKPTGEITIYAQVQKGKRVPAEKHLFEKNGLVTSYHFTAQGDTIVHAVLQNNQLQFIRMNQYIKDWNTGKNHHTSATLIWFEQGLLQKLTRSTEESGKWVTQILTCKNGFFDGFADFENIHGTFNQGRFTGYIDNQLGAKVLRKYVVNELVTREAHYRDSVLLWHVDFDTLEARFDHSMFYFYRFMPWAKVPEHYLQQPVYQDYVQLRYSGFYANGQISAEGEMISIMGPNDQIPSKQFLYDNNSSLLRLQSGLWKFYDPSGNLTRTVLYPDSVYLDFINLDRNEILSRSNTKRSPFGIYFLQEDSLRIQSFKDGKLISQSRMTSYFTIYDCDADQTYEIYDFEVEYDVKSDGTQLPSPTRYAHQFYDSCVLQSEGQLVNGKQDGFWKYYDPQGKLLTMGVFKNGKRDGRWIKGDLDGMAYLGDLCLNPDMQFSDVATDNLLRTVELEIIIYVEGRAVDYNKVMAYKKSS